MKNFTLIKIIAFFLLILSETISAQIVFNKPTIGFTQACASPTFNTYNVTFSFSPESNLGSTNQFIIELSDATGSFSSPITVYTSAEGAVTVSPATLSFALPTTTAGEAYKLRVKSTAPEAISTTSNSFAAYYKIQDTQFTINNLISTGVYCSGNSYLLTIDNPGDALNDSPLQYPSLTFNWYKETSPTTSVFVDTGNSLEVNESGIYFVETNYGPCSSNSYSNRVTISEATSGAIAGSISSSLGNPYCPSLGATTLSTVNGDGYQWFIEGSAIAGATNQMYETSEPGNYSVTVNLGNCIASASINLETNGITSSIDVSDINMIEEDGSLIATVTTDAVNPEFIWYLNDTIISGADTNSYEANQKGNYKVIINQNTGCIDSNEFTYVISEAFPDVAKIPNLISLNDDGINDTWIIPQEYTSGTNTEVLIISAQGKVVLKTNDYLNNWPESQLDFKNVNPVYYYIITTQNQKTRKGTISVVK